MLDLLNVTKQTYHADEHFKMNNLAESYERNHNSGLTSWPNARKLFCNSRANSRLLMISWYFDKASYRRIMKRKCTFMYHFKSYFLLMQHNTVGDKENKECLISHHNFDICNLLLCRCIKFSFIGNTLKIDTSQT